MALPPVSTFKDLLPPIKIHKVAENEPMMAENDSRKVMVGLHLFVKDLWYITLYITIKVLDLIINRMINSKFFILLTKQVSLMSSCMFR